MISLSTSMVVVWNMNEVLLIRPRLNSVKPFTGFDNAPKVPPYLISAGFYWSGSGKDSNQYTTFLGLIGWRRRNLHVLSFWTHHLMMLFIQSEKEAKLFCIFNWYIVYVNRLLLFFFSIPYSHRTWKRKIYCKNKNKKVKVRYHFSISYVCEYAWRGCNRKNKVR